MGRSYAAIEVNKEEVNKIRSKIDKMENEINPDLIIKLECLTSSKT